MIIAVLVSLAFSGMAPNTNRDPKAFKLTGLAQGTNYHITYYAADSLVSKQNVTDLLNEIDSSMSIYKSYSLINKFNNSASGVEMDKHMSKVVKRSLEIYTQSDGVFDITIYPIVDAWGFGNKKTNHLPDAEAVKSLMPCVGSDKLLIKGKQLLKSNPCTKVDVNGIAQGYSVDLLAELLEHKGITNYLVELGGEIRVRGRKYPGNELMKIGIERPSDDPSKESLQKILRMENGAITTSGNYRKFIQNGKKKLSHLMDASTGYPLDNEVISVTVRAKDAMTADGYDNVLIGLGVDKGMKFLKQHPELEAYFIYLKEDGSVRDTASRNFFKESQEPRTKSQDLFPH